MYLEKDVNHNENMENDGFIHSEATGVRLCHFTSF